MANILVVLPYSGRKFGGGLAVVNQDLAVALAGVGHSVKLLTLSLDTKYDDTHEGVGIIKINNDKAKSLEEANGADREQMYALINDDHVLLKGSHLDEVRKAGWAPDLIIGHSRFSGPAALTLKNKVFSSAKVAYFLHSFPIEGSVLVGHEAFDEPISGELAEKKILEEAKWMPQADLVVAMGPLLRAGAEIILNRVEKKPRIHEAFSGVPTYTTKPVSAEAIKTRDLAKDPARLLFVGRSNAAIKGFQDMVMSILELRNTGVKCFLDVRWWAPDSRFVGKTFKNGTKYDKSEANSNWTAKDAQGWVNGVFGVSSADKCPVKMLEGTKDIDAEYVKYDLVLSPSYIEHFGLVPVEALSLGVPSLVSELSGSGMFLANETRFGTTGQPFIVKDYKYRWEPKTILQGVPKDAFDDRSTRWAKAIASVLNNLEARFADASSMREKLLKYKVAGFAKGIVNAALTSTAALTQQGPDGCLIIL